LAPTRGRASLACLCRSMSERPPQLEVPRDAWLRYDRWNEAVREQLFNGQAAGQPVYLDLEEAVLSEIACGLGESAGDAALALRAAVRPTLCLEVGGPPLLRAHIVRESAWQAAGCEGTPPFLAVLALLSLVAEGMRSDEKFRASNYYGRLCNDLGIDQVDASIRNKVAKGIRDESHVLWESLNQWLRDHEGQLGLPTAHAFDYRVHVGVPMSQALVRASDRLVLRELFTAYRLRPGQDIASSDMARFLGEWIPSSRLSQSLRTLCAQKEALDRVADVACIELRAWDGAQGPTGIDQPKGPVEGSLRICAGLRRQPVGQLDLALLALAGGGLAPGPYEFEGAPTAHAAAALTGADAAVHLAARDPSGAYPVVESGLLSFPDLLVSRLRLAYRENVLRRDPRRLVVLERDEELRRFVEIEQVQLGVDNLLLCHQSLQPALQEVLDRVARPGFIEHNSTALGGLPEDWAAFEGVEIMAIAETTLDDLAALVPVSWTQVAFGEGYALPARSTWLRGAPPEVRVTSAASDAEVEAWLLCERPLDPIQESEPDRVLLGVFDEAEVFSLDRELSDGDYRVMLKKAGDRGAPLGSSAFRIRSADHPRLVLDEKLGHSVGVDGRYAISADSLGEREICDLAGAYLRDERTVRAEGLDPPPTDLDLRGEGLESEPSASGTPLGGDAPVCLLGAGHYFILEPAGPGAGRWGPDIEGYCKLCGLQKGFPARPKRTSGIRRRETQAVTTEAPTRLALPTVAPEGRAGHDDLLDALSFLQQGTWQAFKGLTGAVDDHPWFAQETLRVLSALGHLDSLLSERDVGPESWCMAPPTLAAVDGSGDVVLCGFRSQELCEQIREDVAILGGEVAVDSQADAPSRISLSGLLPSDLEHLTASAVQGLGITLEVVHNPGAGVAALLPSLSDVRLALPLLERVPKGELERFDFATGKWDAVAWMDEPGAYRLLTRPLRYYLWSDGELRRADNRLVKWLAAAASGLRMLAYDRGSTTLLCPLGAQLPGLFERAAVLCSGRAPVRYRDGTVGYTDVPELVAARIWDCVRSIAPGDSGR
jgi:hypothetical protein